MAYFQTTLSKSHGHAPGAQRSGCSPEMQRGESLTCEGGDRLRMTDDLRGVLWPASECGPCGHWQVSSSLPRAWQWLGGTLPDGCEEVGGGNEDTITSMVRSLVLPDNSQRWLGPWSHCNFSSKGLPGLSSPGAPGFCWVVGRSLQPASCGFCSKSQCSFTWNSAQCYVPAWMGGEFGREWIIVYVWLSPLPVHLKLSQHC